MNILSLSGFFETLDPTQLLPKADTFLVIAIVLIIISLLIGPVMLLLAGLKYLKAPSPLPNHKTGFRTYFGMGSKAAWDYTQRLAGILWSILGALLTVAMVIVCLIFITLNAAQIAFTALICMIVQASLAVLSWAVITIMATVNFDKNGLLRK